MPSLSEQIENILRSIKKGQSNFKVKTSVFLKKFEDLLFPPQGQSPSLNAEEAALLLKGIQSSKIEGLVQLCGNQGTFGGLKKSAFFATELLYRCLTQLKNKEDFLKVFYQLDGEEFKTMRLASHISQKKSDTALKLCAIIKEKRYHLNIGEYIYSEESQHLFLEWFKKYEVKKKQEEKKNVQWNQNQTATPGLSAETMKHPQSIVQKSNKGSKERQLTVEFFDEYIGNQTQQQFYTDTYVDPISLVTAALGEETSSVRRKWHQNYRIVSYLLMTPSRSIDLNQIQDIVMQIHIHSLKFDPKVLLRNFYSDATKQQLTRYSNTFDHTLFQSRNCKETFHTYHFPKECQMETVFQAMNRYFGKAESVTEKASVGFQLRTKIKSSINKLAQSSNPILAKYNEGEKVRKIILFLQNNKEFTKLPQRFKQLQDQKDYKQICHLFKKYVRLMRTYNTHPILKKLIEKINQELTLLRRQKLKDVYKSMETEHEFDNEVIILEELYEENILENYLVDRILSELIKFIQEQSSRFHPEKIHPPTNLMTKKDLTLFGAVMSLNQQDSVNDGDLLTEYFKQKASTREKQLGEIDLGEHISSLDRLETKLNQFIRLSKKIASGELDSFITAPKSDSVRKETNKSNNNYLASTLVQWYKSIFKHLKQGKEQQLQYMGRLGKMVSIINAFGIKDYKEIERENIQYYVHLLQQEARVKLRAECCLLKQDFNKNHYNTNLIQNLDILTLSLEGISKYALFSAEYIQSLVFPFIVGILNRPPTKDKKELLTYAALCKAVNTGRVTVPHLFKYKVLLGYDDRLEDILRNKIKDTTQKYLKEVGLQYQNLISKEYRQVLSQFKGTEFAPELLDLVSQNVFQVVEYANNLYSQYRAITIQTLSRDISSLKNSDPPTDLKKFHTQIQLLTKMVNRILTKKAKAKLAQVLADSPPMSEEEMKAKEGYILKTKHKYSFRYQSIFQY